MTDTTVEPFEFPEDYQALRAQLPIDWLSLDDELMKMPQLVQEAAEMAMRAGNAVGGAELAYDVIKAEIGQAMRAENERITEAAIERNLPLYNDVQEARMELIHAKTYAKLCEDLVRNLRIKSTTLQKSSDLIISGYITPSAAVQQRRDEIYAARRAQS
jgi:hypothetical protein